MLSTVAAGLRLISISLAVVWLGLACSPAEAPRAAVEIDDLEAATPEQIDALILLTRVWGFLKYHHPAVAGGHAPPSSGFDSIVAATTNRRTSWTSGRAEWDSVFRGSLRQVLLASDSRVEVRTLVMHWLDALGDPAPCQPCASLPAHAVLKSDVAWIRDTSLLGDRIAMRLQQVYTNRWAGKGQTFATPGDYGNIQFVNEASYRAYPVPRDVRLLALARFWIAVEYWFPYRDLLGSDRNALVTEFLPQLWSARNDEDYTQIVMRFAARLKDGHAHLTNAYNLLPPVGVARLPVVLRWINDQLIVSRILVDTGDVENAFHVGDIVVELDGRAPNITRQLWAPLFGASNPGARDRDIAVALTRGDPGPSTVIVEREGSRRTIATRRTMPKRAWMDAATDHELAGPAFRHLSKDVVYLRGSKAHEADVGQYLRDAEGTSVWVVDMRSYPADTATWMLASHFVADTVAAVRLSYPDVANPGSFVWRSPQLIVPTKPQYTGQVVVLVDEQTQSAAEYSTILMQASRRVMVVGSQTAGADGNIVTLPLPGNLAVNFSGLGVFYPDGRPTQRVGVHIDVVSRPTVKGLRNGVDEVLEAGVSRALGRPFSLDTSLSRWRMSGATGTFDCYLKSQC